MIDKANPRERIANALQDVSFAVLATQGAGQPHASFMAFAMEDGLRRLLVATSRDTLKYRNIAKDGRVALLVQGRGGGTPPPVVLTAHGSCAEVGEEERVQVAERFLERHPDLREFLNLPDCALLRMTVASWEVVAGIQDVRWVQLAEGL